MVLGFRARHGVAKDYSRWPPAGDTSPLAFSIAIIAPWYSLVSATMVPASEADFAATKKALGVISLTLLDEATKRRM